MKCLDLTKISTFSQISRATLNKKSIPLFTRINLDSKNLISNQIRHNNQIVLLWTYNDEFPDAMSFLSALMTVQTRSSLFVSNVAGNLTIFKFSEVR